MTDVHAEFTRPTPGAVGHRLDFLEAVDRLPGLVPVRAAMRRRGLPSATGTLVDLGCGAGFEATRLATDHPEITVIGVDRDVDILAAARDRAPDLPNLHWIAGDVSELDLLPGPVDVLRTERVLMYVVSLGAAVESIRSVLGPGGVYTGFELDYGATILPPAGLAPAQVRRLVNRLEDALPQPWVGRVLPDALDAGGLRVTDVEPFSFTVDAPVWSRVVADTLRAAGGGGPGEGPSESEVDGWLTATAARQSFRAVFTGICTTARRP
jgi:SAM-dependent methyltransferase